ncbi:NAD(P)/FAD-dependent oxidoreductase [Mesorhizobium sp. CGMCC 1.15528]|uniref:NAD(P)/FAD-dependent oxidoreductase n=1 Tax=Mesorhizobium zhangyense TaxID=1776730 RepID=A0A7C9V783_9HYPH|nr:NAD(P)/FAD-dependent oxidoreductase [Mesorhizobium zhangyense]NGN42565.1 NAD(P)/FAD-dependent oxidoreductase [Mesorhizobium zhangyense]
MTATKIEDVIVIGSGAAGLAAAHALARAGLSPVILEQEDRIGEPWRRRHKNLRLNTHRDLSHLPGIRFPRGTPAFPSRVEVIDHLTAFNEQQKLAIEFGISVEEIFRDGDAWAVKTDKGVRHARDVVVATGRDRKPFIPSWQGLADYGGRLIHSADFGEASDYTGKSVLVIGAGNSGFDALNHLIRAETGPLWLSARSGPTVLPKRIASVAVHKVSPLTAALPVKLADMVIAATQRLVFGDMTKYGLPKAAGGGASRLGSDYTAIAADDGAMAAIKKGRITIVPGVREFAADGVVLADGRTIHPDVVIAATGYRTGLDDMVGKLGVLDRNGTPLFNGPQAAPGWPGLWFTGMRPSLRGCFRNAVVQGEGIAKVVVKARQH